MSDCFGKNVFKLGFGLMRLPKLEDGKSIDVPQVCRMVDACMAAGGTYLDTAYDYDNGGSENAIKEVRRPLSPGELHIGHQGERLAQLQG